MNKLKMIILLTMFPSLIFASGDYQFIVENTTMVDAFNDI